MRETRTYGSVGGRPGDGAAYPIAILDESTNELVARADAYFRTVSPGYFSTVGVPLLLGTDTPDPTMESPVILNEMTVEDLWPGALAAGEGLIGRSVSTFSPWRLSGIVHDFRHLGISMASFPTEVLPQAYQLESGGGATLASIVVRARPEVTGLPEGVRLALEDLEPDAAVSVSTMSQVRWQALAAERFRAGVLIAPAIIATLLAFVGVFGVVAYNVVQHRKDIGLRIALEQAGDASSGWRRPPQSFRLFSVWPWGCFLPSRRAGSYRAFCLVSNPRTRW